MTAAVASASSRVILGLSARSSPPGNAIGWMLCGLALFLGLPTLASGYAARYVAQGTNGGTKTPS